MEKRKRRIAVVHDFLYTYGGAERVLEQILQLYPEADLYSLFDFLPEGQRRFLQGKPAHTTLIQKLPFARRLYRTYLPLMPLAIEQLDLSSYDMVLSSSYVVAKGVITRPDQLHICYCHTPPRFAWDLQSHYLIGRGPWARVRSLMARAVLHYIRNWDQHSSNGVDVFVANSNFIARRIEKVYRRGSTVIYPPVDVASFAACADKDSFYVTASRLVRYKRIDLIIEAFNRLPHRRLVIIGQGPEFRKLKKMAGANVDLLGYQSFQSLQDHMRRARAFVFAAEEDFGILPVEAQACGTPVIAYGRGGATETVIGGKSGILFGQQTADSLIDAVLQFEAQSVEWDSMTIRNHVERFAPGRFRAEFRELVERSYDEFSTSLPDLAAVGAPRTTLGRGAHAAQPADEPHVTVAKGRRF